MIWVQDLLWVLEVGEAVDVLGVVVDDGVDEGRKSLLVPSLWVKRANPGLNRGEVNLAILG